jgi:cysteine synthase A
LAREKGPGQTIVTLLCDSGHKYQSKLFNPHWLAEHQLSTTLPLTSLL